ncbi:unnamed protein product [Dibothriocephalus latus]|uniref:Uncharacterized protein n=1 Tax=Dibothriocephalus latus TaxID=60516 RepID=A0A3P7LC40_DIBLA|nr:unnamed protein product [Dibothriocephalus latus]
MTVSVSAHNLCLTSNETPPTPTSITSKLSIGSSTAGVEQNGGGGGSRWRFRELFHGAFLSTSPKSHEPVFSPPAREEFRVGESETQRESLFFPNVSNAEDDGGNSGGEDTPPGKKTSHRYSELSTCVESLKPIFEVEGSLDSLNSPTPPTHSPTENWLPPRIPVPGRGPGGRKAILSEGSEESIDEAHSLSSNETPGSPNTNSEHDGNSDLCPEQLMLRGTVNSLEGQAVLRFYECVSVHEIDSDFPRAAERTWMTLTPLDKVSAPTRHICFILKRLLCRRRLEDFI